MARFLGALIVLTISILQFGCDSGSFAHGGTNEEKILGPAGGQSSDSQEPVVPTFVSKYAFKAEFKVLKLDLCEGEAQIHAFSDSSSRMIGKIPCLGDREIDLARDNQIRSYAAPDELLKKLPLYGYFERTASRGSITYDPPVIEMISPVINDASVFSNLVSDEAVSFIKRLPGNQSKRAFGRMVTKVENVGPYEPSFYQEKFNEVIHWKRSFVDFDKDTNFGEFGVYEEMEFRIQPRPFVITQIIIRSKLRDLMASSEDDPNADKEFGSNLGLNVEISLNLKHHETH